MSFGTAVGARLVVYTQDVVRGAVWHRTNPSTAAAHNALCVCVCVWGVTQSMNALPPQVYDVLSGRWMVSQASSTFVPVMGPASAAYGGRIFAFGGLNPISFNATSVMQVMWTGVHSIGISQTHGSDVQVPERTPEQPVRCVCL